jgi:hypothetical protein
MLLAVLGVVGHNSHGTQHLMNPGDQTQPPISGIQTDDTRMNLVELLGPYQQLLCKRSIVKVGRRKEKEERES